MLCQLALGIGSLIQTGVTAYLQHRQAKEQQKQAKHQVQRQAAAEAQGIMNQPLQRAVAPWARGQLDPSIPWQAQPVPFGARVQPTGLVPGTGGPPPLELPTAGEQGILPSIISGAQRILAWPGLSGRGLAGVPSPAQMALGTIGGIGRAAMPVSPMQAPVVRAAAAGLAPVITRVGGAVVRGTTAAAKAAWAASKAAVAAARGKLAKIPKRTLIEIGATAIGVGVWLLPSGETVQESRRRMNSLNPRALARAQRRVCSFARFATRSYSIAGIVKRRRRRGPCPSSKSSCR